MEQFFHTLLTMSATAAIAALVVMVLRLPLKKAPRYLTCLLWLVVLFRMVCPVSFQSPVSIMPQAISTETYAQLTLPTENIAPVTPAEPTTPERVAPTAPTAAPSETSPTLTRVLLPLWAVGCGGMGLWVVLSYEKLRRRVTDAVLVRDNIYETDRVDTPFVCGFLRPRIYLPVGLPEEDRTYVLLHEQAHIRRLDHLLKPFFCLALCLHWFNPVLWLAYWLLGKDIETACDQAVIRSFDTEDTAGYAAALLHLGRDRTLPQAVPLAFGEENPKKRVKHLLDYKHPAIWVIFVSVALCILAASILLADPSDRAGQYEGVALTQGSLIRADSVTPLPDDLRNDLVALLHDYGHTAYTDIDTVELADNTIRLTNNNQGTIFFFHPETLTLVRVNHDGYSNIRKQAYVDEALADDPDFAQWMEEMNLYAETGRAEELLAMKTPYVGNASAVGGLIQALGIPEVVGAYGYTMELQTTTEPYAVILNFESVPILRVHQEAFAQYMSHAGRCLLALVDNAESFCWTFKNLSGSNGGGVARQEDADFQDLYDRMQEAAGVCLAAQAMDTLNTTEVLYVSEDSPFDPETYTGTFTIQPNLFSAQWTSVLSSAWPENETVEGYCFRSLNPEEVLAYYPDVDSLNLEDMLLSYCYAIHDSNNQDTGYRVFEMMYDYDQGANTWTTDRYVAHMTFSGEVWDWVMDYLVKVDPTTQ
ncbi:MAG: DUF4825 domain-containing protein [Ruminiclostridium sp.]|nr:DUF4825 domain-containing protein [Ruminiclostridium sp.]